MIPIYWKRDQTMQPHLTPELIVVADDFQPYTTNYFTCKVINPGSFLENNCSFKCYCPADDAIEDYDIPDD